MSLLQERRPFGRRLLVLSLIASMLLGFGVPAASATSSQSSGGLITHYQAGKAPVVSAAPSVPSTDSRSVKVLASDQSLPQPMEVSGGYVYWYAIGAGELNRVAVTGGSVQTLATVSSSDTGGYGLTVAGKYVFWEYVVFSTLTYYLYRTDISTGKTKTIFSASTDLILGQIASHGNHVYFIENGNIYTVNTNGKGMKTLATDPSECPMQVTYSAGYVYWLDACSGQVGSVPATGGTAKLLSPSLSSGGTSYNGVDQVTVSGSGVYWAFNGDTNSSVDTVSTSGTGFKMLYSDSGTSQVFAGVAYGNPKVLFCDGSTGVIYSVPGTGGSVKTAVNYPAANVQVVGTTLYLSSSADSTIGKTAA